MPELADDATIQKIPCVAVILYNRAGQVFLQQRDQKPGLPDAGCWTLWGGKVEAGETADEAIYRELHEQLELHWWIYAELKTTRNAQP